MNGFHRTRSLLVARRWAVLGLSGLLSLSVCTPALAAADPSPVAQGAPSTYVTVPGGSASLTIELFKTAGAWPQISWRYSTSGGMSFEPLTHASFSYSSTARTGIWATYGGTNLTNGAQAGGTPVYARRYTLTVSHVTLNMTGWKFQAVWPASASTMYVSTPTVLVVLAHPVAPRVISQPVLRTINAKSALYQMCAVGSADPVAGVKWQLSKNLGHSYSTIPGGWQSISYQGHNTRSCLDRIGSVAMNGNLYRAVFSNAAGSVATSAVRFVASRPVATSTTATPRVPSEPQMIDVTLSSVWSKGAIFKVTWRAPRTSGTSPIRDYLVRYSTNSGKTWHVDTWGASARFAMIYASSPTSRIIVSCLSAVSAAGKSPCANTST